MSAVALLCGGAANATIKYNLQNVTFSSSPGGPSGVGTLTGSFTTDDARTTIIDYSMYASSTGSFIGSAYNVGNSFVSASSLPSQFFQIDVTPPGSGELRIYFANGLSASGGAINSTQSYESEISGGVRYLSGSVVAATSPAMLPEPAAWAMMIVGFGAIGAAMRRRKDAVRFA